MGCTFRARYLGRFGARSSDLRLENGISRLKCLFVGYFRDAQSTVGVQYRVFGVRGTSFSVRMATPRSDLILDLGISRPECVQIAGVHGCSVET